MKTALVMIATALLVCGCGSGDFTQAQLKAITQACTENGGRVSESTETHIHCTSTNPNPALEKPSSSKKEVATEEEKKKDD